MNASIWRAIRIAHESRFPNWSVDSDERWQHVLGARCRCGPNLRIAGRTASSDRRLRMASGATIEVETRPQAIRNRIDLLKDIFRNIEVLQFQIVETRQRSASPWRAASH